MTEFEFAEDYGPEFVNLVREMCLYVLPELADFIDQITIVGGAVPSLLLGENLPPDVPPHVGSIDLDLCLALAIDGKDLYSALVARLRELGFESKSSSAAATGTRWQREWHSEKRAIVDVLPLLPAGSAAGSRPIPTLRDSLTRQLPLAFRDRQRIRISGKSIDKKEVVAAAWVCGPGAYTIIKALTYQDRGEPKDAYDLYYVLRNYGDGVGDVVSRLAPLLTDLEARKGLKVLEDFFLDENDDGPIAVAVFIHKRPHPETQAEVVGLVRQLVQGCGVNPP
jgi:hypothetical protein